MPNPEFLTSPANPLFKEVRKALTHGGLTESGCCIAETFHLLEEAIRGNCRVDTVIVSESARPAAESCVRHIPGLRLVVVPDRLLDGIAQVGTSQGVIAVVEPRRWTLDQTLGQKTLAAEMLALVIDRVQDPGNLGTILRSAEAFGATGILMLKGTVSPFNPKALRASAGSVFRVPFVHGLNESDALDALRQSGARVYAAVPSQGHNCNSLAAAQLYCPCAIVIGSEGEGVSDGIRRQAMDLSIPTAGIESLNAAISAAILLYEARRQRTHSQTAQML